MNIYQGLWFHIIHQLTNLGVSSDELFKLGKKIWYDNQAYDELLISELNHPHSRLSEHERELLKGINSDPILMKTMRKEITEFTLTLTELFVNHQKQIVQRKRPKYVEFIINEKKGKFSCVYESSKTMEDIIRYLRNNDLPQGATIAIKKRNASHYVFHIITPHS